MEDLAFRTIKAMVVKATQLQLFDPDALTFVTTDASDVGAGGMLSQVKPGQAEKPICFFNKTWSSAERNYDATQ